MGNFMIFGKINYCLSNSLLLFKKWYY